MKYIKLYDSFNMSRINDILDKISSHGIESLTPEEKEDLDSFDVSKMNRYIDIDDPDYLKSKPKLDIDPMHQMLSGVESKLIDKFIDSLKIEPIDLWEQLSDEECEFFLKKNNSWDGKIPMFNGLDRRCGRKIVEISKDISDVLKDASKKVIEKIGIDKFKSDYEITSEDFEEKDIFNIIKIFCDNFKEITYDQLSESDKKKILNSLL